MEWHWRGVLCTKGQGAVVVGKSVSHHHCHSAWKGTELQQVNGDTGMMEVDWATGAYGESRVTEIDSVRGSIYSGDPGVDSHHLISSYHTTKILTISFPTICLSRSSRDFVDLPTFMGPHGRVVSHPLTPSLHFSSQNYTFPQIRSGCRVRCNGMFTISSQPSSSVVTPQQLEFCIIFIQNRLQQNTVINVEQWCLLAKKEIDYWTCCLYPTGLRILLTNWLAL